MCASRRKKIAPDVETEVLVACRRRCCICFFVNGVKAERPGQLAHIDRNPRNNAPENLVWLCMEHHDAYDSRTSQSKGLTAGEIRHYRAELHSVFANTSPAVVLPKIESSGEGGTPLVSSSSLLGRIIEAYDLEVKRQEVGAHSNGIALAHLANVAATEAGDFSAAVEALLFLLRLWSNGLAQHGPFPTAPAITGAGHLSASARVLRTLGATDFNLLVSALERAHDLALMGDQPFSQLRVEDTSVPHKSFPAIVLSLCAAMRSAAPEDPDWMADRLAKALGRLLMAAAMLLVLRGEDVPPPPGEILVDISGRRRIPEGYAPSTELFIWTTHQVADLPLAAYELTVKEIAFRLGIHGVGVDASPNIALADAGGIINRWALWTTSSAITWLTVKSEEDASAVRRQIESVTTLGQRSAEQARTYVAKERSLLESGSARIAGSEFRVKCSAG